jgi:ankyrin repeat protein
MSVKIINNNAWYYSYLEETQSPPLFFAAYAGNLHFMKKLINEGADINYVNSEDENAFFHCIKGTSYECADLLLSEHGFDINSVDKNGDSCIFFEIRSFNFEGVKFLLDRNSDINITNVDGNTPLITASIYGHIEMMEILIEHGANPDIINNEGYHFMDYIKEGDDIGSGEGDERFLYMKKILEKHHCNIKPAKR